MSWRRLLAGALPLVALVVAVFWEFGGALAYSFSQDDYNDLARTWGVAPPIPGPWRWISHRGFYLAMRGPFGLDAFPYHVTSLLFHAACSLLIFVFLRRRLTASSAWVAAFFFAAHPSSFTIAYWVSAHGDSLALLFALAAIVAWEAQALVRLAAVPLFALSLLSKESTLLLPAVLAAVRWATPPPAGETGRQSAGAVLRDPVWWSVTAVAAASATALYLMFRVWVARPATQPGAVAAYSFDLGTHVFQNALTYLGWAANFFLPTVPGFSDAVDPRYFPWGIGALVLWAAGLFWMRRRPRPWIAAAVVWLAFLAPVLVLRHHTLHYYGYAGLFGVAWMVGLAFDRVFRCKPARPASAMGKRRGPERPSLVAELRPVFAAVLCALLVVNGHAVVKRIEEAPLGYYGLQTNSTVNRALVGARLHEAIRAARLPAHTSLYFWSPARAFVPVDTSLGETYWERNARSATQDGLSVRLLFPEIDSVTFLRDPRPIPAKDRYVVYGVDGSATVATWGRVDSVNARHRGSPSPEAPPSPPFP